MNAIDAPYNFVPLSGTVITPKWAALVSHDLPFKDGLSGEIHYTLTAHSPLLVGGQQTKNPDGSTTVEFFKSRDGYAIPGSSLKGMIRSVLEVASFSRMSMVDDKRYGLRDITGSHVAESYTGRVRNRVKCGFLNLGANGEPQIVPCDMARLSHRDLENWWQVGVPIFRERTTVREKYRQWAELCRKHGIADPALVPMRITAEMVSSVGAGPIIGFPVFTGQISDCTKDKPDKSGKLTRNKYKDFVFHSPTDADAFRVSEVDRAAWGDFLFIHGDEDGTQDMPWPGYWKGKFWNKEKVPVFYIRSADRLQIGLAYMPKLAGDFSVHDMISHTSPDHLNESTIDLAALIFGRVGTAPEDAIRGRVQFGPAVLAGTAVVIPQPRAILSSPKPTYFPNYIAQKAGTPTWKLTGGDTAQYATYLETQQHPRPEIRGWKRYPARPNAIVEVQEPVGDDQQKNTKIQLLLKPLQAACTFSGRVIFHNLKPEELGALIWCLGLGGEEGLRHSLGLGKPFGFGQVELTIRESDSRIVANDPDSDPVTFADCAKRCVERFVSYMDRQLDQSWRESTQIRSLRKMTNPGSTSSFPGSLKHMVLARIADPHNPGRKQTINQFQDAKKAGLTLAPFVAVQSQPATKGLGGHRVALASSQADWPLVPLAYNRGTAEISSAFKGDRAYATGTEARRLLDKMDPPTRQRLERGKLQARLVLERLGGRNWKIIDIIPA